MAPAFEETRLCEVDDSSLGHHTIRGNQAMTLVYSCEDPEYWFVTHHNLFGYKAGIRFSHIATGILPSIMV